LPQQKISREGREGGKGETFLRKLRGLRATILQFNLLSGNYLLFFDKKVLTYGIVCIILAS